MSARELLAGAARHCPSREPIGGRQPLAIAARGAVRRPAQPVTGPPGHFVDNDLA